MKEANNNFYFKHKTAIFAVLSFSIPLLLYILTLEKKVIGGDTTWYALYLPKMYVMVPTGYPTFSIIGKLFSIMPFGQLAYRLNLISAVFGALTILFLFLAINKFIKNQVISFVSSLTYAFLVSYWTVANRLEFDTINSFFIALMLFSVFLYEEEPQRKNFYFFAAALGLSLTNHPIAFFIVPAILLYVILINPKIFKNAKAVLLGILFFMLPLILYAWLPIRSLQGYGPVKTLRDFIYYITGRNISGEVHGGSFEGKNIETFLKVSRDFFLAIYNNMGILLLLIALAGLVYLFKKNRKFAFCSILLIILNLIIISLYLGYSPENYSLNAMMIFTIYLASGFALILDFSNRLIKRYTEDKKGADDTLKPYRGKKEIMLKKIAAAVLIAVFMLSPVMLAIKNYPAADLSQPAEIYTFWEDILNHIEDNSVLYVSSSSSNIGEFINTYEKADKNITFITNKDERYSAENIYKDLADGKKIYFVGLEEELKPYFNIEKISGYTWDRMDEYIVFYDYAGEKKELEIIHDFTREKIQFGEKFKVEYRIINKNKESIDVTSIELEISDTLRYTGVDESGSITIEPSLSRGKYMWVKTFPVDSESELNIIIEMQAATPGDAEIDFQITSQNSYFEAEDIEFQIVD